MHSKLNQNKQFKVDALTVFKMRTVLFLGAGASVFALQPTTSDLLKTLISKTGLDPTVRHLLDNNIVPFPDIEQVYASIDEAINFKKSHIYELSEQMQRQASSNHLKEYNETLDKLIALKPIIREIILDSFKLTQEQINEGKHLVERLEELINRNGSDKFQIVTTNYDLIIYEYADSQGREVVDGFSTKPHSLKGIWDDTWNSTADNPIYLNKLHGSVNWQMQDDEGKTIIKMSTAGHRREIHDVMIAPTLGEKDYKKTPFNELTERFKNTLEETDVLIVIGFSFRDDELNEIIKDKIANKRLVIISISPDSHDHIKRLIEDPIILDVPNLRVLHHSLSHGIVPPPFLRHPHPVYSYESKFELDAIDGICSVLNAVLEYETRRLRKLRRRTIS